MFRRRGSFLLLRTTGLGATYYTAVHQRTVAGASGTTAYCDAAGTPKKKRGYTTRKKDELGDADLPPPVKLSLNKILDDTKETQKAVGGPMKGDEALALMALLAREMLQQRTARPEHHFSPLLVSPPLSSLRTRQRCQRFLEYAILCDNVYDLPSDKEWLKPPQELGPVDRWTLLSSHPGGVCIPRHVILRVDGGMGTKGRRRTKRLLVVVRGTAEVTDAAINIAMTPSTWQHQGCDYSCHPGIVESAAFLVRMARPALWRAIDELKQQEGVDPGDQLEVVFTGHSLGGATAAVAALELQGEFGPRVPVRCVGFSTPASLSEDLAASPLTRRFCTTVVLGDDMIPRCSTRNLQELKRRAANVLLGEEVDSIKRMVTDEVTRRGDEWTKQLSAMLLAKASEAKQQLPPAIDKMLPPLPVGGDGALDVDGLKKALGGVLASIMPAPQQDSKTPLPVVPVPPPSMEGKPVDTPEDVAAALEQALKDYQAALDAEIEFAKGQLERIKRDALQPFLPSSSSVDPAVAVPDSPSAAPPKTRRDDEEEEDDDEAEEEALLAANAAMAAEKRRQLMDVAALQAMLQKLVVEQANLAASAVKSQTEARVKELLTNMRVDEVKDKAAGTVKWVADSWKGLQAQAKAALPLPGRKKPEVEVLVKGVDDEVVVADAVALYPPGEIFWIHPVPVAAAGKGPQYELRRVRDVHWFDGIVLSPTMMTDHLLTSTIRGLKELSGDTNRAKRM